MVFPESEHPVHKRWEDIVTWLPEVRGRILADDMEDILKKAEEGWTGLRLFYARDLAILQSRYFVALFEHAMCPFHLKEIMRESSLNWQRRLNDRLEDTRQVRRRGNRIRKGRCPPPKKRDWAH